MSLSILTISVAACHTSQPNGDQQAPFTLLSARSQEWIAGREEGGSGTEYYFKVALHTGAILFDSMWINNKALPVFIARETTTVSGDPITYTKGDTIILRGSDLTVTPVTTEANRQTTTARFRYILDQKAAYYTIEKIEKQPTLNLPSRN